MKIISLYQAWLDEKAVKNFLKKADQLRAQLQEKELSNMRPELINPLALAYLGDAI